MDKLQEKLNIILHENAIEIEDFANCLGLGHAQAHALFEGKKKMTTSLARQIEQTFSKSHNWLDCSGTFEKEGPNYDLFG